MVLMREAKQYTYVDYMGNPFENLEQMCKYHGVSLRTFKARQKEGQSLKECLKSKVIFYKNTRYENKKELCEALGVNQKTIESRVRRGETFEEAIDYEIQPGHCKPVTYRGVTYPSIAILCKTFDVDPRLFYKRKARGANTIMACLGHVPETIILDKPFVYRGKEYTKYEDMCHDYRKNPRYFYKCLAEGWTFDQIFGFAKEPARNSMKVEIDGMMFYNKEELCKVFGVTTGQFDYARKQGRTIEQALKYDERMKGEYQSRYEALEKQRSTKKGTRYKNPSINPTKLIKFRGQEYNGIEELANKHGQPYKQVAGRLARGWSIDEALYGKY